MIRRILGIGLLLAMVIIPLLLSMWQWQRLAWKEALLARQQKAVLAAPVAVGDVVDMAENAREFQPFTATGMVLPRHAIVVGLRAYQGKSGYHVIVPMRVTEGAYRDWHLLMNAGWLPVDTPLSALSWPQEPVTIRGIARLDAPPRLWLQANKPEAAIWRTIYIDEIASTFRLKPTLPFVLQADVPVADSAVLQPLPRAVALPNNHRQYALTWLALTVCAAMVIGRLWWNQRKQWIKNG